MDEKEFHAAISATCRSMDHVAANLRSLAMSFSRTGNSVVAKELTSYADLLDDRAEQLQADRGAHLRQQFDESTQQMGRILTSLANKVTGEGR